MTEDWREEGPYRQSEVRPPDQTTVDSIADDDLTAGREREKARTGAHSHLPARTTAVHFELRLLPKAGASFSLSSPLLQPAQPLTK